MLGRTPRNCAICWDLLVLKIVATLVKFLGQHAEKMSCHLQAISGTKNSWHASKILAQNFCHLVSSVGIIKYGCSNNFWVRKKKD
jgi:hypothetical protein